MAPRRNRNARTIAAKTAAISVAAPQVIAHRLARMAAAGPTLTDRDRKEFQRMGAEKAAAFTESWYAMALQIMRANQALATSLFWSPWSFGRPSARVTAQLQNAALGVLSKGIAPVHRKATANAKRLARTKLRES